MPSKHETPRTWHVQPRTEVRETNATDDPIRIFSDVPASERAVVTRVPFSVLEWSAPTVSDRSVFTLTRSVFTGAVQPVRSCLDPR